MSRRTGRAVRVLGSLVAAALVVACSAEPVAIDVPPTLVPIARDEVPVAQDASAHRGEIVSVDRDAQFAADFVDAAGAIQRAIYRSTSGVTGQPTQVAGVLAVPKGAPPTGGWPVVSVGHGTTGIEHGCGPSLRPDLMGYQSTLTGLLSAGFAVAMSDYEGLDNIGVHPYLEPRTAAFNVIDAVRALGRLFPDVSTRWATLGGSQGGQAAWAANEFNQGYGQGLQLVGAVALAPPANLAGLAELAFRQELTKEQRSAFPLLVVGLERAGVLPSSAPYLRGGASPTEPDILGCSEIADWKRNHIRGQDIGSQDLAEAEALQQALREIALPQKPLSAPLLVINGTRDQLVLPDWVSIAVHLGCELGGDIQHVELSEAGHSGEFPYGEIEKWLTRRFADEPTQPTCT